MTGTSSSDPRLPTFLIIGAMKAGTTSLAAYLATHPQVFVTTPKEPDFFLAGAWERGTPWYRSLFEDAGAAQARGEASVHYTAAPHFPGVPARMKAVVPDARLV